MLRDAATVLAGLDSNLRALTHVESLVLTNRYANAFVTLSKLSDSLQSRDPFDQGSVLAVFAFENAALLDDVIAFGSDQHSNRAAVEVLSLEAKLLAFGQILALTGERMKSEESQFADIPAPSAAVH